MTWQDLLNKLNVLSKEKLQQEMAIYNGTKNKYYFITGFGFCNQDMIEGGENFLVFYEYDRIKI